MEFDWDAGKAETNFIKHGVSFLEAASVFNDDFSIKFFDLEHSVDEERLIIIGQATRRERQVYENVR